MDMKKILQALDSASSKPVEGSEDMKKFVSIIQEGTNPHKVSLPVQMAMHHYQEFTPKKSEPLVAKESVIGKYFKLVEDEINQKEIERKAELNQYASIIAERVRMRENKNQPHVKKQTTLVKKNNLTTLVESKQVVTSNPDEILYCLDDSGLLLEYSMSDFGSDISDVGRGAASGVTFGYSDNIVAKAKSLLKGTSYADELKAELEKTAAAQERSPYLYTAGEIAGTLGIPGMSAVKGVKGVLGLTGARLGSDLLVRDPHNQATIAQATPATPPTADQSTTAPSGNQESDQQLSSDIVKSFQTELNKNGFDVGRHGVDGIPGPDTMGALQAYRKKNNISTDYEAIAKLLGVAINEDVANIKKLAGLNEAAPLLTATLPSVVRVGGQVWKAVPGVVGKFSNSSGKVIDAAALKALQAGSQVAAPAAASTAATTGAQTAAKGTSALMQRLSSQSPKIATGLKLAGAVGGKMLDFMKNHKFLSAIAAMALYGYTFGPDGNVNGPGVGGSSAGQGTKPPATGSTPKPETGDSEEGDADDKPGDPEEDRWKINPGGNFDGRKRER